MRARTKPLLVASLFIIVPFLILPHLLLAAEESEDRWGLLYGVGRFFNLALVVGVVVWAARKPLANFFTSRTENIREQLAEAQKARQQAESKLAEIESRMSRLDDELRELQTIAEKEAKEERERLIAEAERDAEKIIARARQEIDGMTRAAHMDLKEHAAELAVQLAENKIREQITDEDRGRLFARFVTGLEEKR